MDVANHAKVTIEAYGQTHTIVLYSVDGRSTHRDPVAIDQAKCVGEEILRVLDIMMLGAK